MKVYFIKPGGSAGTNFPHSYATLGAWLKSQGHNVFFHDASLQAELPEQTIRSVDLSTADLLGISIITGWQQWVRKFVALVKTRYPGLTVVVGGPHISALNTLGVEHAGADFGIAGEGELPLGRLIKSIEGTESISGIPGAIYRDSSGKWCFNQGKFDRVKSLDELPLPDYELVQPSRYFHTYLGASVARKFRESVQTVSSRGCPYECTFCATNCTWQRRMSFASPERVIAEIRLLVQKSGVREIWFGDDGFSANKQRVMEICDRMIKEDLVLPWRLPNGIRVETIDEELVLKMKQAGCYMVGVGVETGSPRILTQMKKRLDLGLVREKAVLLKKHGILASGFFIMGMPDETEEDLELTRRFILESGLERMQISVFAPYPGSEEFKQVLGFGTPAYEDNIRAYLYDEKLPPVLKHVSMDMVQKYYQRTVSGFYLMPSTLMSLLRHLTLKQIRDICAHPSFKRLFLLRRREDSTHIDLKI